MKDKIEFIAFDADDTLWESELYIQEFEHRFCKLLGEYLSAPSVSQTFFETEMKNLHMYGYGLKSIMLSMAETICKVTDGNGSIHLIEEVIGWGQELLQKPVTLLEGVKETISSLHGKYKLVLATKGDLFDQKRKIAASGLQEYFHHIEIMSDKKNDDYRKLIGTLGCLPEKLLMIGNSVKSDILPVLELGGYAAYVPYHVTWAYEQHEGEIRHRNFIQLDNIKEILDKL